MADQEKDGDSNAEGKEEFQNVPRIRIQREKDPVKKEAEPEKAAEKEAEPEPVVKNEPKARVRKKQAPAKKRKTREVASAPKGAEAGTFCATAGRATGEIVRALHDVKKSVGAYWVQVVEPIRKGVKSAAAVCRKSVKKRKRRCLEEVREELFVRLGGEVSQLAKEDVSDVFGQEKVEELVNEIRETERLLEETRESPGDDEKPGAVVASSMNKETI